VQGGLKNKIKCLTYSNIIQIWISLGNVHEDRLSHYTATTGHCKNAILLYNQLKGSRPYGDMAKYQRTQFQHVKGAAPLEICQLLYRARVQQKRCWRMAAIQMPKPKQVHYRWQCACADTFIRNDGIINPTYTAWELDILLCNAQHCPWSTGL
jgi:hypothetical protein